MNKKEIRPLEFLDQVYQVLKEMGLLLVSVKKDGDVNVMTIGWGLFGRLWDKDFALVAVRPSRHTFNFIEESEDFTINVPTREMADIVEYCGTISGRDENKIKQKGLNLIEGVAVNSPIIEQCCLHFECRGAYKTKIIQEGLPEEIITSCYPQGDFHTLYFGEILDVRGDEDIESKLNQF